MVTILFLAKDKDVLLRKEKKKTTFYLSSLLLKKLISVAYLKQKNVGKLIRVTNRTLALAYSKITQNSP